MINPRVVLRNLFRKKRVEGELHEELNFHLAMQIENNIARGMSEEEAKRQANLQLGGVEQTKESIRQIRLGYFWETLLQDIRYAKRSLLRDRAFLIVAILSLTLGIGANTAIFSVTRAVLLKPLPYPHPERLLTLWGRERSGDLSNTNYATFVDWKQSLRSFEYLSAMSSWAPTLSGVGDPVNLEGMSVSSDFLKVLGVMPMIGRNFLPQEDRPDQNRVVILSYGVWRRYFNSDAGIIGRQILLSGIPRTVVGVMPRNFQSLPSYNKKEVEIFRPLGYDQTLPWACRTCNHLQVVGRLRARVGSLEAGQEVEALTRALISRYPRDYGIAGAKVVPLHERFVSDVRAVLIVLLAAVLVILLIACANIANLMLARATRRAQEMAIRAALGAGKFRLMRQLLTESMLLASIGGTMGILLAYWLKELLLRHAPFEIPRLATTSLDLTVLLFAALATFLSGLIFGLAPALQLRHLDIHESLAVSALNVSGSGHRVRSILVVANIGMALLLLSSAGLLLHSLKNLLRQELGFQPEDVVTMTVSVIGPKYDDIKLVHSFYNQALQKVHSIPGVGAAGLVSQLPLSPSRDFYSIRAKDKPLSNPEEAPAAERYAVSSDYLKAMRIAVIRGRGFSAQDTADSVPVVLVNRKLAERIWPNENPIGKQIQIGELNSPWRTIVGIVAEVRHQGLDEPFGLQFYMPYEQWSDTSLSLVVRSKYDAGAIIPEIRRAISAVDKNQPVSEVVTMTKVVESNMTQRKTALTLVELFALLALFLSAIGVYGMVAYNVTRRMHEIGIRVALGADNRNIVMLLTGSGVRIALLGIALGLFITLVLGRFLQSLLFHVKPADPFVLAGMAAALFCIAAVASMIPALRATRSNPLLLLRQS